MEFEKNLKQLEDMVESMSGGDLNLKKSLEIFKKANQLIEKCKKDLSKSEQIVKKLINEDPKQTEDFDYPKISDN